MWRDTHFAILIAVIFSFWAHKGALVNAFAYRPPQRVTDKKISFPLLFATPSFSKPPPSQNCPETVDWIQKVLDSYRFEIGSELIPNRSNFTPQAQAAWVASSSWFIASHDFLRNPDDAIYNYGNSVCLNAFGYSWEEFVALPSRYCVRSDDEVSERQQILDRIKEESSSTGKGAYDGLIRYRKDGKRILLNDVTLWNVFDTTTTTNKSDAVNEEAATKKNEPIVIGQAVCIKQVDFLDEQ